jgi:hypothetical protein
MDVQTNNSTPPVSPSPNAGNQSRRYSGNVAGGVVLIVIGALFLAHNFVPLLRLHEFWPLILVGLGVYVLSKSGRRG